MTIRFGECVLDVGSRQLWRAGTTVHLSPKAFELLKLLVERRPDAVSKSELHQRIWPETFVTDDSLSRLVAELRDAMGDDARSPRFVRTLHGFGYAFSADTAGMTEREVSDPHPPLEAREESSGGATWETSELLSAPRVSRRRLFMRAASVAVVLIGALFAVGVVLRSTSTIDPQPISFVVLPPEGTLLSPSASLLSISPNGRHLAFVALSAHGRRTLWVRSLESVTARELPGTDDALAPFWSPDSRHVGFFANGKLKRIDVGSGPPQVIADARGTSFGGTWNQQGSILFGGEGTGLFVVPAGGGTPRAVTRLDVAKGEAAHSFPSFLPDGRYFTILRRTKWGGGVYLGSLDSPAVVPLLDADSQAIYTAPGYLLFLREGVLYAQRFDARLRRLAGESSRLAERVGSNPNGLRGMFSASDTGVLAYRPSQEAELIWFDRTGRPLQSFGTAPRDQDPALSPDGRRIAVDRFDPSTRTRNIWILESDRGVASRLTSGRWDIAPVWSPDGTRVAFASDRREGRAIFEKPAAGGPGERMLVEGPVAIAADWSRDGHLLFYTEPSFSRSNIAVSRLTDRKRERLIETPFSERTPRLSPDSRWLAYSSDETGRAEVYVTSFPGQREKWRVSSTGGVEPVWRADGKELFYVAADQKLMAVSVHTGDSFRILETPAALFQTRTEGSGQLGIVGRNQYVASPDGQRFLIRQAPPDAPPPPITVVVDWTATLQR